MFRVESENPDIKYRLNNIELNALCLKLVSVFNPELFIPDTINLKNDQQKFLPVVYQDGEAEKKITRQFYLTKMNRDSASNFSGQMAPYFIDTLREFARESVDRQCTLLIPLFLCRNFAKALPVLAPRFMQRNHAVLLEVDLATQEIDIHDSQGLVKWALYPDKIAEKIDQINAIFNMKFRYNPKNNYHCYAKQKSSYDCGYFTYAYILHFFKYGSSKGLDQVFISIALQFKDKADFMQQSLGAEVKNLLQRPDADNESESKIVALDDDEFQIKKNPTK